MAENVFNVINADTVYELCYKDGKLTKNSKIYRLAKKILVATKSCQLVLKTYLHCFARHLVRSETKKFYK